MAKKKVKLSKWAKMQGISYRTANRWFNDDRLPDSVEAEQTDTGSIFITYDDGVEEEQPPKKLTANQKKKQTLEQQFNQIQNQHSNVANMEQYMVSEEDLPGFGELELYDYDNDLAEVKKEAEEIINNLVDLYLGDNEEVINHPYIKGKMKEDARIYADSKFLERMSKKLLLQQLRQIDNGDNSARMYEVSNQTMREIREINKEASNRRTEIEKLYKEIRRDLGQPDMAESNTEFEPEDETQGQIIDTSDLNSQIDDILKNRKIDKDDKRE